MSTQLEEQVRAEQEEFEAQNGDTSDEGKTLFDRSQYDREDLAIQKIDGEPIDRIALKFAGTVYLDRSDPADVALYNQIRLGHDVTIQVEGRCSSTAAKGATDREGELDVVVGERTVKVHTVYRPAGADLDQAA